MNADDNSSKTKISDDLEAMRQRPEMYVGSGQDRMNDLLMGALCFSLAEAHCGSCTRIHIKASQRTAEITTNGKGLEKAKAEEFLTVLNACRDHHAQLELTHKICKVTIAATNALSETLRYSTSSTSETLTLFFSNGKQVEETTKPLQNDEVGTKLTFTVAEQFSESHSFNLENIESEISQLDIDLSKANVTFETLNIPTF